MPWARRSELIGRWNHRTFDNLGIPIACADGKSLHKSSEICPVLPEENN
jgi:hypothetical protein